MVGAYDGISGPPRPRGPVRGSDQGSSCPASRACFAREVLRAEAGQPLGHYDAVHSHYWLSGQVGALARDRWGVPLVHSMHTMAKVKNDALATDDTPEPAARIIGEEQVVEAADMLIANTGLEAQAADPRCTTPTRPASTSSTRASTSSVFRPLDRAATRLELGLPADAHGAAVRRPDPAAEGARRAAARGRRSSCARSPEPALGTWWCPWSAARPAAAWSDPSRSRRSPTSSASTTSSGSCRRSGQAELARWYAAATAGRGALLQRVVRAGRRRGAGHRHPGRRRGRRRAHDGRARPAQRPADRRPRPEDWATALGRVVDGPRACGSGWRRARWSRPGSSRGRRRPSGPSRSTSARAPPCARPSV